MRHIPTNVLPTRDGERGIRLVIAYDGTAYSGWQVQSRLPTVQGAVESALGQLTQQHHRLRSAGRTDAGVHALGQVASFRTTSRLSCERLYLGLNALLPDDVGVNSVTEVAVDFDARRFNRGKHYRYTIYTGRLVLPQLRRFAHHERRGLDLTAMARAASQLVGTHDFAAFRASGCERETTVRTLYRCTITRDGPAVLIDVEGTAFLKHMVRIICGTLIEVGLGRRAPGSLSELLQSGDRRRAGPTVPARGLCLMRVFL